MTISPTTLTPSGGVTVAVAADAAPRLLRPKNYNCKAGTVPSLPSYSEVATYTSQKIGFQRKQAELAYRGGCIPVIGDSQMQAIDVSMFSPYAVPFAAGGDTVAGYVNHLVTDLTCLSNCGGVIIQVSQNDTTGGAALATVEANYDKILAYLTGPLVMIAAYPLTSTTSGIKSDLVALNAYLSGLLAVRSRSEFVSINDIIVDGSGNLLSSLTYGADGQHVTDPATLAVLASRVRAALRRVTAP